MVAASLEEVEVLEEALIKAENDPDFLSKIRARRGSSSG
jgi:hypothetical protein